MDVFKKAIIEKYFNMVYKLAISQTKDTHHAEDVTNDVFLKFLESDKQFESDEHAKAWLIRVTINQSKSLFSTAFMRKTVPLLDTLPADMPKEESDIYMSVMKLPQKYRTVIHLFYYEDMSIAEISNALGRNPQTVKSQLSRGRAILRETLKGDDEIVW